MITINTILFTYHRYSHTKQVIEGLKQNTVLPQKLIIFQDGKCEKTNIAEWNKVNYLIKQVDFCPVEVIVGDCNKGLAKSIEEGINYALESSEAVIVIEDDCIPAPDFMKFMTQGLICYENKEQVYNISGYAWNVDIPIDQNDAYFCGRSSSWGWGTWKDRWVKYSKDVEIISRIKSNKQQSINLSTWGSDLEFMLEDSCKGKVDSWAVYWALIIIENEGLCLNPYKSLVSNIGHDGTGVNCGDTYQFDVNIDLLLHDDFMLPDRQTIRKEVEEKMIPLYGSYLLLENNIDSKKDKLLIYGQGRNLRKLEKKIYDKFIIEYIVDNNRKGFYSGRKLISSSQIKSVEFDKILISLSDHNECMLIKTSLVKEHKVSDNAIIDECDLIAKYGEYDV